MVSALGSYEHQRSTWDLLHVHVWLYTCTSHPKVAAIMIKDYSVMTRPQTYTDTPELEFGALICSATTLDERYMYMYIDKR